MNVTVAEEGAVLSEAAPQSAEDFASWVAPHLTAMAHLAGRLVPSADRDDVVQDALVRAWRRRATYDADRGSVSTWLLAIVASCARRSRARGPRDQPADPAAARRAAAVEADPRADPDHRRDLDLERALRALPKRERLAVTLYYFVDLDLAATAAVMGCSTGTVKATLHHARERLRALLGGLS